MRRPFPTLVAVPLAFVVGVVLGSHFGWTVTAGDALQVAATIGVAVAVSLAAGQLSDRHKFLVERIVRELDYVCDRLGEVEDFLENAAKKPQTLNDCQEALRAMKRAGQRANFVRWQVERVGFGQCSDEAKSILEALASLRTVATSDDGFPGESYSITSSQLSKRLGAVKSVREAATALAARLVA